VCEIVIFTGIYRFNLSNDEAVKLLEHIRDAGGEYRPQAEQPLLDAINHAGHAKVRWSEEGKIAALRAIESWLLLQGDEGEPAVPKPILDLRYELMRDLRLPPFDA
jgi:hypothetical protein